MRNMPETTTFTGENGTLEFCVEGVGDGRLLLHHGLMGSAGLAPEWASLAAAAGVQVLTVARPGYGRSTPAVMDAIAQWAGLVSPLLAELGWQEIDVAGISAGAPYAYALAARLGERVRRVAICGGLPDVVDPAVMACYPESEQEAFARYARSTDDDVAAEIGGYLRDFAKQLPAGHRWLTAIEATLAHEGAGVAREVRLQQLDWGFDMTAITQPVHAWHAREDDEVPFAAAELTIAKMSRGRLRIQAEPSHFPSAQTGEEVFEYLASAL